MAFTMLISIPENSWALMRDSKLGPKTSKTITKWQPGDPQDEGTCACVRVCVCVCVCVCVWLLLL